MGRVYYCTREEVQDAFDTREAAHRSAQIDSAIASASDDIDGWLNRHKHGLAPTLATRYFNWPQGFSAAWRIWLDENELVSVTSITSGGIPLTSFFLEPVNSGPPFTYIEVDLSSTQAFTNANTWQHAVQIVGTWGIGDDQKAAGALAAAINSAGTVTCDITDSSLVGVGHVMKVDSERMQVTNKRPLTTGVTLTANLNAQKQQTTLANVGATIQIGELIIVGSERMKVVDNDGTNLTVVRAYDGSVLAAHTLGDTIYAYRRLTVVRGVLGTTAATHLTAAPVTVWAVPDLVRDLCRAEVITRLEQEFSAYGARVFSDEAERDSSGTEVVAGRGLTDLRKSCARRYKRKFRKKAI